MHEREKGWCCIKPPADTNIHGWEKMNFTHCYDRRYNNYNKEKKESTRIWNLVMREMGAKGFCRPFCCSLNYMFSHWFKMYDAPRAVVFHNWWWHVQHFWNWRVKLPHEIDVSRYALHLALNLCCFSTTYIVCLNLSGAANWRNFMGEWTKQDEGKERKERKTIWSVIMRENGSDEWTGLVHKAQ